MMTLMTMNLKKVFTLTFFSHRLFVVPAFERAILFRNSTKVELSYYIKKMQRKGKQKSFSPHLFILPTAPVTSTGSLE